MALVVGLTLMGVGMHQQAKAAKKQARAQAKVAKLQKASQAAENKQRRLAALRQQRLGTSALENVGASMGVGSSGIQGAIASAGSRGAAGMGVFNQQIGIGEGIYQQQLRMASAQKQAQRGAMMQQAGGFMMGNAGQLNSMGSSVGNAYSTWSANKAYNPGPGSAHAV